MPTFYIIRHAHKEQGNFYNPRLRRQPDDLAEAPLPNRINSMEFPHINLDEILKGIATHNLTVTGRIVDEQGNVIYQASVMLAGDTGQRGVTTEQDGSFIFPTIAAGQNRVHVEKYGFIPGDSSLTVPQTAHETIRISQA